MTASDDARAVDDQCLGWYTPAVDRYEHDRQLRDPKMAQPLPPREGGDHEPSGIGICCSGGGIRSAAYNLGALQELSLLGTLSEADYLSAVSGGSYIASAFATVTRHSDPALLAAQPAFAPGSPEESFVRNRCSYLADGMTGKVRLVVSLLLGILANVLLLALLIYAAGHPMGWLYGWWQHGLRTAGCSGRACFRHPRLHSTRLYVVLAAALAGAGLLIAVLYRMFRPPWGWRNYITGSATVLVVSGAAIAVVFWVLPELLLAVRVVLGGTHAVAPIGDLANESTKSAASKGQSNLVLISGGGFVGTVAVTLNEIRQHLTNLSSLEADATKGKKWYQSVSANLRKVVVDLAGYLIGPVVILAGLLFVMNGPATRAHPTGADVALWIVVVLATLFVLQSADLTSWSMHPFYKRRLASAFSVKRTRGPDGLPAAVEVDFGAPQPLTDFAPMRMQQPFPELLVCAAANISDAGVTPPGVRVDSFVFSPSCIGGPVVGGMATTDYETRVGKRRQLDVTLPAAVAMSGAAVSPEMGKMTRGSLRFLLALGNVRLGVWMPNPRRLPKGGHWSPINPRPRYLLNEIIGRHRINSHYLYITDGGHYDNLGLVELLRRKCTRIICFDASGGSADRYSALGEAIAIARAELNANVIIDPTPMRPTVDGIAPANCVAGTITYADHTQARLIYAKAAVVATDPWDVRAYVEGHTKFPGDPTLEQLYTGQRFEAYRILGANTARAAHQILVDGVPPLAAP